MAKFAFTSCVIGSNTITSANTLYGTGEFREIGWDTENATGDGINNRDRITKQGKGSITVYDNQISACHPTSVPSQSYTITMTSSDGTSVSRTGVVTRGVYNDSRKNTVIEFSTDPIPPAT